MKRIERSLKGRYWRKVITYFLTCCLFLNTTLPVALAEVVYQPEHVDNRGVITVIPVDPFKTNMTAENGAIGHFSDFDIATGHFVDCDQPNADSSALFRINSADGTQIQGRFDANGSVYLIDPAGILFDAGHELNVNRLIASGLNMSNGAFDDAMAGGEMVFSDGNGEVRNQGGVIRANDLYLIGQKVLNNGPIVAPDGLVVMVAGEQVILAQDGSNVSVVVSDIGYSLDIRNSNVVSANNGKIVLAAGDTFSRAISNVSYIDAPGGEISIQAAIVENRGRILANASSSDGDGGSISLIGTEEVVIGPDAVVPPNTSWTYANGGVNGNGGTITITAGTDTVEGKVTIEELSLIKATGGSGSGNGGEVTITCDNFEIAGDIDASFGNKVSGEEISEPGKLEITASSSATDNVTIADGANVGAMNTIYEEDIEALSQAGTSLIVNAEKGITVKNITDGTDPGEITGKYGSIELHATGDDSAVTFADITDTIRTTLGDIVIEAGSGGITAGNLTTGKDISEKKPTPGQILLSTNNDGDITTGDLTIRSGWGHAEINVDSSHDLTVNGDVIVGSDDSFISNVPLGADAEAMIYLNAVNNVELVGEVKANAHGIEEGVEGSVTRANIEIAGTNVTINSDLTAEAKASSNGTADAIIKVEASGDVTFVGDAIAHAIADQTEVQGTDSVEDPEEPGPDDDHAQIYIDDSAIILEDDNFLTPKYADDIELDVLANDILEGETIDSCEIDPAYGSLTKTEVGDKLIYNPPEDLTTLTFNENGEAVVTFTYTVSNRTATGTITLTNALPVAIKDEVKTYLGKAVSGNVLSNDIDADKPLGDILKVVEGTITTENGTLVLNEDGSFTYTPNDGFIGTDKFTYSVTDSFNTSSEVEVKITVSEKPIITVPSYMPPAPGLERMRIEIEISGCPALVKWAAEEIGIDQRLVQIWVANSLASTGSIQPCDACEGLKNAAKILQDANGTHMAALAQVINEFASSTAPPTEEQMASIADAITRNTDEDSYYAVADEYLDALAMYVGILSSEMGFSAIESVQLVTDKYVGQLTQGDNVGVATFIAASLAALGE